MLKILIIISTIGAEYTDYIWGTVTACPTEDDILIIQETYKQPGVSITVHCTDESQGTLSL